MIQVKRKNVTMSTRFVVAIVICIAIVLGIRTLSELWKDGTFISTARRHAKESLVVIIELDQREQFFEQLKRFAGTHAFNISIDPTTSGGDTVNISMTGKDVIVLADNLLDSRRFEISFYDQDPANPTSTKIIDDLINDLKSLLNVIPNIRIFDGS